MKVFGWIVSVFAALWLIWDIVAIILLNQIATGFSSGDVIMWVLEVGCLVSGIHLLRGYRNKRWVIASITCLALLVLDMILNLGIMYLWG